MKKVFLLTAIAVMVMASCTKNEIIDNPETQKAISFSTFTHKATKAYALNGTTLNTPGNEIPLNAYLVSYNGDVIANGKSGAAVFFNDNLEYDGTKWDTTPVRYWPNTTVTSPATKSLSFFAYYPGEDVTYTGTPYTTDPANNPTLEYTIKAEADQVDLVAGMALEKTNVGGATDQVDIQLDHLLSQVNFFIKGDLPDLKYVVSEVKIGKALGNIGVFTYGAAAWNVTPGASEYTYQGTMPKTFNNTGAALENATDGKALMLMPQIVPTGNFISVKYKVLDADDNEILAEETRTVAVGIDWAPSKNYVYTITLQSNLNPITYNITVNTWDAPDITVNTTI